MTIFELADLAQANLIYRYYANQKGRFMVKFEYCEVKEGSKGLLGLYGNGKSCHEALEDYVKQIRGRVLVFNAMREDCREFGVPHTLTHHLGG